MTTARNRSSLRASLFKRSKRTNEMKNFLRGLAALLAISFALPAFGQTVPTYVESATGNTKAGVGVSILGGAASVSTDASTTVTLGGTYQTVFASSTTRLGCLIQNPTTATEVLNVRVKSTIVWTLPIGATFSCASSNGVVISDLVEVTAATTGHAFTAARQ